ncbi:MAG: apolipoprotein N-acyltransferase, partial [Proteobacteria bacterium]
AEAAATPIRVALIQPGTDPLAEAARDRGEAALRAARLAAHVRDAVAADPAIRAVVLPEKAIEFEPWREWNRAVHELAPALGVEVWTGGSAAEDGAGGAKRYFNSAFRLRPDGAESPRYDKNALVPFGERMPFGSALAWLSAAIGRTPFAAGDGTPLHDALGARFAFLICYEAILPERAREPVQRGAALLVNLTYDGWFGDTAEPAQHLMLVAAQAAQLGVPVLRATTTGLSAFVDARGRVVSSSALFERRALVGDVRPLRAGGAYAAHGAWLAWGCAAAGALLVAAGARTR